MSQNPMQNTQNLNNVLKPKVFFKTFGCRTNLFDTQIMINALKDFEVTLNEEISDIVIINSCAVTNGAESAITNYTNRLKNEGKRVYFTGCGVKMQGKALLDKGVVFAVFGHSLKENLNALLLKNQSFYLEGDLESLDSSIIGDFVGKSRAFIKIQEGCDFACSYCIIPSLRGKARSFTQDKILTQIQKLCDKGFSEFILTGTNLGSWGKEWDSHLTKLLFRIFSIQGVKRLRIGSLEPSQINEEFLEAIQNPLFERHLHIALQHTSPFMLKLMNRQNTFENDFKLFWRLKELGFALGSDFIVGHPKESKEIWEEAYRNLQSLPLTHCHSFIYSPRSHTPSSLLKPDVPHRIAKERKQQIQTLIQKNNHKARQLYSYQKIPLKVLVEEVNETQGEVFYRGFDQFYNKVKIHSHQEITKDSWLTIPHFTAKEEENYAQI